MDKATPTKLIFIEGGKNVGKSYMIDNSPFTSYKFPFAEYFNKFLKGNTDNVGTGDKATFHFSTAFDVTVHSMANQGLFKEPILVDRGFLSNLVLGVVQKRITDQDAKGYMDFLNDSGYLSDNVCVIYIQKNIDMGGGRTEDKDQWEYLNYNAVHDKYIEYLGYAKSISNIKCQILTNYFSQESLTTFNTTVYNMLK